MTRATALKFPVAPGSLELAKRVVVENSSEGITSSCCFRKMVHYKNLWKSIIFIENSLNFSHYSTTEKISSAILTEIKWIFRDSHWFKFECIAGDAWYSRNLGLAYFDCSHITTYFFFTMQVDIALSNSVFIGLQVSCCPRCFVFALRSKVCQCLHYPAILARQKTFPNDLFSDYHDETCFRKKMLCMHRGVSLLVFIMLFIPVDLHKLKILL